MNYIHKHSGYTAERLVSNYKIIDSSGKDMGCADESIIHNPVFGWTPKEEFLKGEWIYVFDDQDICLFRLDHIEESGLYVTNEAYVIDDKGINIFIEYSIAEYRPVKKATPDQILSILSKVAEHKGYKNGVKVKSPIHNWDIEVIGDKFTWHPATDNLYFGIVCESTKAIYSKGQWAEIVKEESPKEEEDWRKAKVFSYEDIEKMSDKYWAKGNPGWILNNIEAIILEEEAKKRIIKKATE